MDFVTRRPDGIAARMWAAASEAGIGPHDPLAPFIDALADAAESHQAEMRASITELRGVISSAQPRFDADNMRTLAHTLRHDVLNLARSVRIGVLAGIVAAVIVTHAVAFGAGYIFHGSLPLISGLVAGPMDCHRPDGGGKLCTMMFWQELPPPVSAQK